VTGTLDVGFCLPPGQICSAGVAKPRPSRAPPLHT